MRTTKLVLAMLALLVVFSGVLSAQILWKPEASDSEGNSFVKSIQLGAYFNNYLYKYNDGDLRATDNTSIQTVEITDDNIFIGYLELGGKMKAELAKDINFYLDVYRVGYWGNDSPEYTSAPPIYFRELFFNAPIFEFLTATVGRFRYSLNPAPYTVHHNYVMTDLIDAVLLSGIFAKEFRIDVFADLFSMNAPIDSVYELRASRHSSVTKYFDGDVNIIRFAFIPQIKPLDDGKNRIDLRPYAMFSRIGATGSPGDNHGGNELTDAGAIGNHADNDWLFMAGLSTYTKIEGFSAAIEFGFSMGKDRRGPGIPDVDFSGIMAHASLAYEMPDVFGITLAGIYASGAETDKEGHYTNYGYMSFKADKIGGFLFRDYYGVYPYGILGTRGLSIEPTEAAKRSPMAGGMFRGSIEALNPVSIDIEFWAYLDTSTSGADFEKPWLLAPDKFDQKRFGEFMGWELDVRIAWSIANNLLSVGVDAGLFVPGKFFAYQVASLKSPFGNDKFYGLTVFSALRF